MAVNAHPQVDIIVPCYNVGQVVGRCIQSLLNLNYPRDRFRIVAVDDGSRDDTAAVLKGFRNDSRLVFLQQTQNRGLSAARNLGIRAGDSEVICFLDSDMTVHPDWLLGMLETLAPDGVVGAVGDNRLPAGVEPNRLDRYFYSTLRGARRFGECVPIKFPWFLFNNTAVKRTALERVGLFDESISSYGGEDTELAIRLWEAYPEGLRFTARAVSEHHHQRSIAEFCAAMESYGARNLPYLLETYPRHRRWLGGLGLNTPLGYLLFNPVIRMVVNLLTRLWPRPALIRYLVIGSAVKGYRRR